MDRNQHDAFTEAITYLYSFIDLERKRQDRYMASKMDVTRPGRLLTALGSPHTVFPSIHIAGTKGKGSVAAMSAFCLREAGLKVGLYTSPHLVDFRERIRILTPDDADGRIPEDDFIDKIEQIKTVLPQFPGITWFEILTAIAFLYFAAENIDIAVVEVGLGGRLDATNVLTPLISVITSLSLDHTTLLGNTLAQIAGEKGGIIKQGIPVVIAPQPEEAMLTLQEIAEERSAPIHVVGQEWQFDGNQQDAQSGRQRLWLTQTPPGALITSPAAIPLNLFGDHQLENATVTIAALNAVRTTFPTVTETAVRAGLTSVQWPGRLQIIHAGDKQTPTVLVDCAHNPDSAAKLRHALLHGYTYDKLCFILGAPADKDVAGVMQQLLPLADNIIVTTASHPRSIPPEELAQISADLGFTARPAATMSEAMQYAWQQTKSGDLICVSGSIIVVGDLLNQWDSLKSVLTSASAVVQNDHS
ncbi:MAG: bifunctional folylpolyglutamate synthase/dihydrofolate synthase [Anaerolineales bacterium]|nr:bifunctional folylpolyglutamate synthase/dihydrofolate synthase [Anaerolineales bacterium]MCA9929787.1 bifunctional folylpolyglutamate synthase/dihydrofolate synthase [Anaerolineales bacterium]